jgi:hypothetical protein
MKCLRRGDSTLFSLWVDDRPDIHQAEAFRIWDEMLNGDLSPYPSLFFNVTGSMVPLHPQTCNPKPLSTP